MGKLEISSQTTFLYFENLDEARRFFDEVLELEVVYDPKWACVWRIGKDSYVGAVDTQKGSIVVTEKGGVLISITVRNIEEVYDYLKKYRLKDMTEIIVKESIGLKSFIFTGPEGYKFEIQQFITDELYKLF